MGELKVLGPDGKVIPPEKAVQGQPPQMGPKVTPLLQIDLVEGGPKGAQYGVRGLAPVTGNDVIIILAKLIAALMEKATKENASRILIPGGG